MNTGDLVFYSKYSGLWSILATVIQWWTQSPYVHVGFILKDPKFLGLKGTYIWQAEPLGGVTISPFDRSRIHKTRKYTGNTLDSATLKNIFDITNGKPYDKNPMDWIEAMIGKDFKPQRTNAFWCSALVGCILTKLGILDSNTDWSIMSPAYLAEKTMNEYTIIM